MKSKSELKSIAEKEGEILAETKRIEHAEEKIHKEEKRILAAEQNILSEYKKESLLSLMTNGRLSNLQFRYIRTLFTRRLARHKLLFGIIGTIGVVLIWRGVWHTADATPVLSWPVVSFLAGVLLIWLIKRYTDLQ